MCYNKPRPKRGSSPQQVKKATYAPCEESYAHTCQHVAPRVSEANRKKYDTLSPVLDELPRDVIQAVPVADANRLQLPLRSIKDLSHPPHTRKTLFEPRRQRSIHDLVGQRVHKKQAQKTRNILFSISRLALHHVKRVLGSPTDFKILVTTIAYT